MQEIMELEEAVKRPLPSYVNHGDPEIELLVEQATYYAKTDSRAQKILSKYRDAEVEVESIQRRKDDVAVSLQNYVSKKLKEEKDRIAQADKTKAIVRSSEFCQGCIDAEKLCMELLGEDKCFDCLISRMSCETLGEPKF